MGQSDQFEMVGAFTSLLKSLFEIDGMNYNAYILKNETRYLTKGVWRQVEFCYPKNKETILVIEVILFSKTKGQLLIRPPLHLQGAFYEWDDSKEFQTALEAVVNEVQDA